MLELNFTPFPVIETDRMLLREIFINDAEEIFILRNDDAAMKYISKPKLKTIDDAKDLIKIMTDISERIQWGITLKGENKIIGTIGYHRIIKEHYRAEIGYMLLQQYWNNGLISEAITSVIDYGFREMKLHSIEAIVNPANEVSKKILRKFNFIKEAYFKENFFFEGKFLDFEVYSLLKS